jgi:transcriptional regulator with XRE-family HTH domain
MAKAPLSRPLASFGLNVRKRRESLHLTQLEAAERADLDPTYISGIERGVRNPSLLSIARVAKALDLTVSELCAGVRF